MKDRIKKLRKELDLTQQEFADRIGISRGNIAAYEVGKNALSNSVISLICREFGVNEEWLRNGTGEMFSSDEAEYDSLIDRVMSGENEFAKNIFKAFSLFDVKDWEALQRMIDKYNSVANSGSGISSLYDDVPDTPEELERRFPPVDMSKESNTG